MGFSVALPDARHRRYGPWDRLQAKGRMLQSYVESVDLFQTQDTDVISQARHPPVLIIIFRSGLGPAQLRHDRRGRWGQAGHAFPSSPAWGKQLTGHPAGVKHLPQEIISYARVVATS